MSRLIIASNRLPVTLRVERGEVKVTPSTGGLAAALRTTHEHSGCEWVGWAGEVPKADGGPIGEILAERRLRAVPISSAEMDRYYDGFSNGVLWPLLHYLVDRLPLDAEKGFGAYRTVNQRFADVLVAAYQPGDVIWVHDYHLMLVPALVRRQLPEAKIGFFLHVPFPAADIFRVLPQREELLLGVLGADLVGFHTQSYQHNFADAVAQVLGTPLSLDRLRVLGRSISLGAYPVGVDFAAHDQLGHQAEDDVSAIRAGTHGKRLLLGVDRLDYTKGIKRRLLSFDRFLEREPTLREKVHFVQLAVPSREKVDAYTELRRGVNELVGRINGHHGTITGAPVQLLYRSVPPAQLAALYRAADVMVVTPVRDGMNLVAKEYVATRIDDDGVLVLSEFAGASTELAEALTVNPYDLNGVASTLKQALTMPRAERAARMRALRQRVKEGDVDGWATTFLGDLDRAVESPRSSSLPAGRLLAEENDTASLADEIDSLRGAESLLILLDYDGSLVPFAMLPELATPDAPLLDLLRRVVDVRGVELHVISGRSRQSLTAFLGDLPIGLHAEHGAFSREADGTWSARSASSRDWLPLATAVVEEVARRTLGAHVEVKETSVAFHYRRSDPTTVSVRLSELRARLADVLQGSAACLLDGHAVLEVRDGSLNKGVVARMLASGSGPRPVVVAGDDHTDEDMFRAVPDGSVTIRVGPGLTTARYRVGSPKALRSLLERLA
ncbi:MAG: bifunctional alpha,alpha-trehalose-phosphate synthase (UDP-forming)/trehalose-phosphatase [Polyangiaceae bacterium]|nr:bifunctional alpha,alpha-trehalose-phosphate synthase (UDP-forming)/trehalose-phosphatase [Polyangiaceae bacterium]